MSRETENPFIRFTDDVRPLEQFAWRTVPFGYDSDHASGAFSAAGEFRPLMKLLEIQSVLNETIETGRRERWKGCPDAQPRDGVLGGVFPAYMQPETDMIARLTVQNWYHLIRPSGENTAAERIFPAHEQLRVSTVYRDLYLAAKSAWLNNPKNNPGMHNGNFVVFDFGLEPITRVEPKRSMFKGVLKRLA